MTDLKLKNQWCVDLIKALRCLSFCLDRFCSITCISTIPISVVSSRPNHPHYGSTTGGRRAKQVRTKTTPIVSALMSCLNEFAANTSMHGINRIKSAASSTHRMMWVCFVLAATCGFFYHVNTLITTYFEYPVSMSSKVGAVDFEFPDVTICLEGTVPRKLTKSNPMMDKMKDIEVRRKGKRIEIKRSVMNGDRWRETENLKEQ